MNKAKYTDPMTRSSKKNAADTVDETKPEKVNQAKLSWRMPILKLSTEVII